MIRAFIALTAICIAVLGSVYFVLIGLGFMFVEIGLIQRISIYLGHPVYGMAIGLFGISYRRGSAACVRTVSRC